jgi:leader peptidase (prepilin peptidase)/N-methyltransferase
MIDLAPPTPALLAAPLGALVAAAVSWARFGAARARTALAAAAAAGLAAGLATPAEGPLVGAAVAAVLAAAAAVDAERRILPDALTLPLIAGGLAAGAAGLGAGFGARTAGAALGFAALAAFAVGFRRARGRDGVGGGDLKLLAAGGAWIGPEPLAFAVAAAAGGAAAAALARRALGRAPPADGEVAFGPWLAAAIWAAMALGPQATLAITDR